ncbi:Tar ligand binding domain-containing protein [Pseudomonas sp. Irchel s3h17]|uniref:Tar ligand binding domain-containing protein n=1 Tax=Pseudomonas sp. Irchel s3h17 TaxID=2009182 RepID=UPI001179DC4E
MKQWKVRTHLLLLAGTLLTSLMCIGALGLYGMRSTVQDWRRFTSTGSSRCRT